jgi:hypothetical protein
MASPLDDLLAAAVRAWATVARTWIEAANAIGVGLLDLPAVESGRTGFNAEVVVVPAQQAQTALRPGRFADWDDKELPPASLAVVPAQVGAGEVTEVCVRVHPAGGIASGTYTGSLFNSPGGACLVEGIGVYVVGDSSP